MIVLFFDRQIGKDLPIALQKYLKPDGAQVRFHSQWFKPDTPDEEWLGQVGEYGWSVIAQDYQFHLTVKELERILEHKMACFYVWGAEASTWQTMQASAKAYDRIIETIKTTTPPYIFRADRFGRLRRVNLDRAAAALQAAAAAQS